MVSSGLWRTLSAFNHSTRRWAAIPSSNASQWQVAQGLSLSPHKANASAPTLSLVSWNIDAISPRPVERSKLILNHVLKVPEPPSIIFLQEVTSGVRDSLLNDARVRNAFLVTDAEDQRSFKNVPFATMTLLSNRRFASGVDSQEKESDGIERGIREGGELIPSHIFRVALPSKYERDALSVDIIHPTTTDTVLHLINVHLDSLGDTLQYRAQQIGILANVLREPGCGGGIIAGDFNTISPKDHTHVDKNGLVDAWIAFHGPADANEATWGVSVELRDGRAPGRLDKATTVGVEARKMEALRPGYVEVPRPAEESLRNPWSDHCGLTCTFSI